MLLSGQEVISDTDREGLANTLNRLLNMRLIPVINGNDVVAPPSSGGSVSVLVITSTPSSQYCLGYHFK